MNNSSYDAVPYQSNAFAQSQREQLAVMAQLLGLQPILTSNARVLELGCSAVGNIIPLAARYPRASFLGIDLSERQVEMRKETIAALGLQNIDLRHADIASIKSGRNKFDYIICHGFFPGCHQKCKRRSFALSRKISRRMALLMLATTPIPAGRCVKSFAIP